VLAGGAVTSGGGQVWLEYLEGKTAVWWGIAGLSILTDLLFVPIVAALYLALRGLNRIVLLAGAALLGLFVIVDLAVTWPNFASLITLGAELDAAAAEAERAAIVAAATYPAAVLDSSLFAVYVLLVPALGILAISWVMRGGGLLNRAGPGRSR
jgi:hypothetical protein